VFGGTSVAAPIIAATFALAGNTGVATGSTTTNVDRLNSYPYAAVAASSPTWPASLNDVTTGKNKNTCGGATKNYLCNAGPGYDGPTGLGTPNGVAAFAPPPPPPPAP
jgi:hypothetical protein